MKEVSCQVAQHKSRYDVGMVWWQHFHCCAGVWEAINVLDAAYENKNEFQPRTLSIAVQDKPGVLNEVCKVSVVSRCMDVVACKMWSPIRLKAVGRGRSCLDA